MILDLHIHSRYSPDSLLDPAQIIRVARARGLDGIAVTDHGTARGGLAAREIGLRVGYRVIAGAEYVTEYGHIVGLFLNGEPDLGDELLGQAIAGREVPFATVVRAIRARGGIAVLAHPFQSRRLLERPVLDGVDALEGFNARAGAARYPDANTVAASFAAERGLPVTGGSDAHLLWEIGRGCCQVEGLAAGATDEEIRRAILAGQATAGGYPSPRLVIPLTQMIRMRKTGNWRPLPRVAVRLILSALGPVGYRLEKATRGREW